MNIQKNAWCRGVERGGGRGRGGEGGEGGGGEE